MLVPPLNASSRVSRISADALRKASYKERDRGRELDPGALDFDLDDVEEEDEEEDDVGRKVGEMGGTGRQRALKIMQARDAMPAAGE